MGASIRGTVQDSGIGLFLQGARISVEGTDREAYSERGGKFEIRGLRPGTYRIAVSYVGYPTTTQTIELTDADAVAFVSFDYTEEAIEELEEFRVEGSLIGAAKALNVQRSADNLKSVVSSDDIGQFVDRNAAEALQRLPGISVTESQGEGKFVIIRGADPSINSVAIDGIVAATPEEDGRSTALNIISIEQLESIEVTKSWLPDQSANFIGGSVNLITRSALDRGERFASIEAAYGQHDVSEENSYRFSANYGDVLLKKKNLGIQFSFDFSEDNRGSDTLRMDKYEADVGIDVRNPGPPNGFQLEGFRLEDFIIKRERTGFSGKVEYAFNDNHSVYFNASSNSFDDDETLQQTRWMIQLSDSSYAGKTVFDIDVVQQLGLDPSDPEIAARLALPPDERPVSFDEAVALGDVAFDEATKTYTLQRFVAQGRKSWQNRVVNDSILTFQGGGQHRLFDRFDLDYKFYRSEADKDWREQNIQMQTTETSSLSGIDENNVPFFIEQGDKITDPEFYRFDDDVGLIQDNEFQSFDEKSGYEVNLETKYQWLNLNWSTKIGIADDSREKRFLRDFQNFRDVVVEDGPDLIRLSDLNLQDGNLDGFLEEFGDFDLGPQFTFNFGPQFSTENARDFIENQAPGVVLEETAQDVTVNVSDASLRNFEATEDIFAGYLMQSLDWRGFKFIAGFRYEKTENTFTNNEVNTRVEFGERPDGTPNIIFASPGLWKRIIELAGSESLLTEVTSERSYEHWLPAFHVSRTFGENLSVRASYTQTIARPKFTDLIPREIIGVSGFDFATSVRLANFELRPTESENFDISIDRYFGKVGVIGVNFFHKKLDGPIYTESRVVDPNTPLGEELNQKYASNPEINSVEWETTRQANAGDGEITGVEFTFDRKLDFLPGMWSGLGFAFNTTFADSNVKLPLEERLDEEVPLFKQSDRLTNLSVYYEKYGFLTRASFLWRGGYLDEVEAGRNRINNITNPIQVGAPANSLDTFVEDFFRLDLRIEYRIGKWGTIFFEGTNLTNEPVREIYGDDIRLASIQYTRAIYFIGYKWNL